MALKDEYKLKKHQESAADMAVKRDGNILLSHPVGSGKTLSSIGIFERLKEEGLANRALVVTPASLRTNYGEKGVQKFTNSKYRIYGNKQEISSDKSGVFGEPGDKGPEYGIVSYELFREDPEKYIKGHGADTVIFDEVHRIKNDDSKTFKALKESRDQFRNFIGMTGSIASNTPADVVPLIDAMTQGKHRLGSKASFENRFVTIDKQGNKGLTNKMLVRALLAPYVHHVTDEEIHESSDVPPPKKIINHIEVPLSDEHSEYYRYVIDQLDPVTKAKLRFGISGIGKANMDAFFAKLLKSRQVANSIHMINPNISLEESAEKSSKVKKLLDDVEAHLKETPDAQVVVHSELIKGGIDVLEAGLKKRGIEFGKFLGKGQEGITEASRQTDVKDFNSGKKKVILLSSAGGEGIDLPNTTMVASLDGHWNPEKINQVEARGVRMGGLAHREEKDRKVIINRYIAKVPLAKVDTIKNLWMNVSPERIIERAVAGEPVFYNPFKRPPSVDQAMYQIAAQKAKGNDQLKSMFEKTSAFSIDSDKRILNKYLDKYGDRLLTGDYDQSWIDEQDENRYISALKQYYTGAKNNKAIYVKPGEYESMKDRGRLEHAARSFGKGSIGGALAGSFLGLQAAHVSPMAVPAVAAVMGVLGGAANAWDSDNPHYTTQKAEAKKFLKLNDAQLRDMLRGQSVDIEEVKRKSHFIRMK